MLPSIICAYRILERNRDCGVFLRELKPARRLLFDEQEHQRSSFESAGKSAGKMLIRKTVQMAIVLSRHALDILVPPRCINCNKLVSKQTGVCTQCWQKLRFIERPFCEVLGTPFSVDMGEDAVSIGAMANPPPFERLRSVMVYDDLARAMISRFKFSDRVELTPFIAKAMHRSGRELLADADIIVPLPLYWKRLVARRYNQSAELARTLSRQSGVDYNPSILKRIRNTKQQVGLTSEQRKTNVAGAFAVTEAQKIHLEGRRILLIDDVYTTGASVKAATRTLKRAGAKAVDVLTFAIVHHDTI